MKVININKHSRVQNPFEFCIGNGQIVKFNSKRNANQFIAETNRYLTKCLVVLNQTYIELLREYRLMWIVSINNSHGKQTSYSDPEKRIKNELDGADAFFEKLCNYRYGGNDPFFGFVNIRKIALYLKDAADLLAAWNKKRNHTAHYYNCNCMAERCLSVMQKMADYKA